jgi:hypothetical protein
MHSGLQAVHRDEISATFKAEAISAVVIIAVEGADDVFIRGVGRVACLQIETPVAKIGKVAPPPSSTDVGLKSRDRNQPSLLR